MNKEFCEVVASGNYVVLDTETTGLEKPAEICQIAIIDPTGAVMLDTLVKPVKPIPPAATAIHGIDDNMCRMAFGWQYIRGTVLDLIEGKAVIVYNAIYDRKLMHWSDEAWNCPHVDYKEHSVWMCAMEAYAEHYGEVNPHYGSYRWQRLTTAMMQQGLEVSGAHSALGDCLMTLQLIKHCCA